MVNHASVDQFQTLLWEYLLYLPMIGTLLILLVWSFVQKSDDFRSHFFYITWQIWPTLVISNCLGYIIYFQLALNFESILQTWEEEFPEQRALKTVVMVGLSAISFMLVFKLQRSRGRWWEARSHIGAIIASLKCVVVSACARGDKQFVDRVAMLVKLYVEAMRVVLEVDEDSKESRTPSLNILLARIQRGSDYWQRSEAEDEEAEDEYDDTRPFNYHAPSPKCNNSNSIPSGEQYKFDQAQGPQRVLLVWKWLYATVARSSPEYSPTLKQLDKSLHAWHGAMKVKTDGIERSGIDFVEWWTMCLLLCLLFPILLAFEFHSGSTRADLEAWMSLNLAKLILYGLSICMFVYFFQTLKVIARDARDPFGHDRGDIELRKMTGTFMTDIDLLCDQ